MPVPSRRAADDERAAFLAERAAAAHTHGLTGQGTEARDILAALRDRAVAWFGPDHPGTTLALTHQLAHWTGESGDAAAAVEIYRHLHDVRARVQGPDHPDTRLARHQVAHWHGRSGDPHEAACRYEELHREAVASGRAIDALELLADVGYWQSQAGRSAAALRTYARMLQDAEAAFGPDHRFATVARQRYAELAGHQPFGHAPDSGDLASAAAEVARSGDWARAEPMFAQALAGAEERFGDHGEETVNIRTLRAQAAVEACDWATAAADMRAVLVALPGHGIPPAHPTFAALRDRYEAVARLARANPHPHPHPSADPHATPTPTRKPTRRPAPPQRDPMAFNPRAFANGTWLDASRPTAPQGAARFGPYRVREVVGEGGMGTVYLCEDDDGALYAVKTVRPAQARRPGVLEQFAHEVAAAMRVDGRYTVPVVAADTTGRSGPPWMAVPFVAAPSLAELAEHRGPLDEHDVRLTGTGIARALEAIHAQGIVHLDLKPANVLMTADGPRVIDFGIAQIERVIQVRGLTLPYASPEQLSAAELTSASDVFSLGTLLATLALGRLPWGPAASDNHLPARIRRAEADLGGLSPDLAEIVRDCHVLAPAHRPTAAEVARRLLPAEAVPGHSADAWTLRRAEEIAAAPTRTLRAHLATTGEAGFA